MILGPAHYIYNEEPKTELGLALLRNLETMESESPLMIKREYLTDMV